MLDQKYTKMKCEGCRPVGELELIGDGPRYMKCRYDTSKRVDAKDTILEMILIISLIFDSHF